MDMDSTLGRMDQPIKENGRKGRLPTGGSSSKADFFLYCNVP